MWRDVFGFIFEGADDRNFAGIRRELPLFLVGGGGDPSTDYGKSVTRLAARMKRMGFSNLVSSIYADTRHESLNELNRNIIMSDFVEWAEGTLVRGPSQEP
jgi:alpha-beta hydrolase superfamily lysophospholipase